MKWDVEEISAVEKRLTLSVEKERVDKEFDRVYRAIGKQAKIKGFRPGKAPRSLLEKMYGGQVRQEVVEQLFSETYRAALQKLSLQPVSRPIVEKLSIQPGEPFEAIVRFEVPPKVEIKELKGFSLTKRKVVIDDTQVSRELRHLQERFAKLKPLPGERPVQPGDFVSIHFEGSIDGERVPEASAENYLLEIGSGQFLRSFEDQLLGQRIGEIRKIAVTFPEDFPKKEMAGKRVDFTVLLKEIKIKELPPLDDEFAKTVGHGETLSELKEKVRSELERREEARAEEEVRQQLTEELIKKNPFEVPQSMIESQVEWMVQNMKQRFAQQGIDPSQVGWDEGAIRSSVRPEAERRVRTALILEEVARRESIEVDSSELREHFEKLSKQMQHPASEIQKMYEKRGFLASVEAELRNKKALDLLLSQSKFKAA